MDFFSKLTKTAEQSPPPPTAGDVQRSNSDIFNSVKVVAGAAQSHFRHEPTTYDDSEVAGASAELLGAASDYCKLDKTQGVGQYVDQAENYLNQYKTSHSAAPAATETLPADPVSAGDTKEAEPKNTSGVGGIETDLSDKYEEDSKFSGASDIATEPDEIDDEKFTKKPSGEDSAIKTDEISGEYEKSEVGYKLGGETGEDLSAKPSSISGGVGAKVEASDDYDQSGQGYGKDKAEESLDNKPSGGCGAEDTTEALPENAPAGIYATTGDAIIEKISETSGGGGFGNFSKLAGDFLKK